MNKSLLSYKGYSGSLEVSVEDNCLHGQILFIDDLIIYEAETAAGLKEAFVAAVDRYEAYCRQTGKPANKPYSGSFNVRVGPDLHRKAVKAAFGCNTTLNEFVNRALRAAVDHDGVSKVEHIHQHMISITGASGKSIVATMEKPKEWEALDVAAFH
ncbi:MAG: hypothetical protein JWQ23_30 [Herminiimonas sp.]|nr:hypothetical protein [Herminiimonas sp.]